MLALGFVVGFHQRSSCFRNLGPQSAGAALPQIAAMRVGVPALLLVISASFLHQGKPVDIAQA